MERSLKTGVFRKDFTKNWVIWDSQIVAFISIRGRLIYVEGHLQQLWQPFVSCRCGWSCVDGTKGNWIPSVNNVGPRCGKGTSIFYCQIPSSCTGPVLRVCNWPVTCACAWALNLAIFTASQLCQALNRCPLAPPTSELLISLKNV